MATYNSFAELGKALGLNKKSVTPSPRTAVCPKCGETMRLMPGTNIYVCGKTELNDAKLPDGRDCQVFSKCDGTIMTT